MSTENKPSEERVEAGAQALAGQWGDAWHKLPAPQRISYRRDARAVLAAADAAGAQQAAPSGEAVPVAWMLPRDGDDCAVFREPQDFIRHPGHPTFGWTPLYAHPAPAPAEVVPAGWREAVEQAETLLRGCLIAGMEPKWPDGTPTPNASLFAGCADKLAAMLSAAPPSQPPSAANEEKKHG